MLEAYEWLCGGYAHSSAKRYGPIHDVILFYTRGTEWTWNQQYQDYSPEYVTKFYRHKDKKGKHYTLGDLTGAGIRHGETGQPWRGMDVTSGKIIWKRTSQCEEIRTNPRCHPVLYQRDRMDLESTVPTARILSPQGQEG